VRDREIQECERFLRNDMRFRRIVEKVKSLGPGPERIKAVDKHRREVYDWYCGGDRKMLQVRA
jgi:hypothetical protein